MSSQSCAVRSCVSWRCILNSFHHQLYTSGFGSAFFFINSHLRFSLTTYLNVLLCVPYSIKLDWFHKIYFTVWCLLLLHKFHGYNHDFFPAYCYSFVCLHHLGGSSLLLSMLCFCDVSCFIMAQFARWLHTSVSGMLNHHHF